MSRHYWIVAIALGLTALTASGQDQEEVLGAHGQAAQQEAPTQPLPLPFPIEVIEDQATAEARQRREEEAAQREMDDLVAQQGMNASTKAMNAATQDMRNYAFYSIVLAAIGTGLLAYTLYLTRQANLAALAAVKVTREIGIAQTRSYISVKGGGYILNKIGFNGWVDVSNSGNSAAINPSVEASINLELAWFGGSLMGTQPATLGVKPFTARKTKVQPGETSRFYFHWTREESGNRFTELNDERYTIVISVRLKSDTIYKDLTDGGEWQLTNYPGFVRASERSQIAKGELYPRQLQRR